MDIYTVLSLVAFGILCLTWLTIPDPAPAVAVEAEQRAAAAA